MARRVLIVDDEPNIVISLEFLMAQAGYEVAVARTGDEALEQLSHFAPDVLLLDVLLPGVDGFDILQRVRQNPAWQHMVILMLTAKGRNVEVTKGLALGANAYVTKPFATHELLAEVNRQLETVQSSGSIQMG